MDKQILSQEELNALLKSTDLGSDISSETENYPQLTAEQKDALGEIGNIGYGSASTALSEILNKRVRIDSPSVYITTQQELKDQHPVPYVITEVNYKRGLIGSNVLILKVLDAGIMANLMLGGSGVNPNLNFGPMELSAIGEAMNQMIGTAGTSLSSMFSRRIELDPPKVRLIDLSNSEPLISEYSADDKIVVISFKLKIEGLSDSDMMLIIPFPFAVEMAESVVIQPDSFTAPPPQKPESVNRPEVRPEIRPEVRPEIRPEVRPEIRPEMNVNRPVEPSQYKSPPIAASGEHIKYTQEVQQVMVQPAQFAPIGMVKSSKEAGNIALILDVPLQVSVELGSTRMRIKEILELGVGSIIELDKLAGDPVDIYVNDKLIAKGEVVVIDENFGIKITDIISPIDRANNLQ